MMHTLGAFVLRKPEPADIEALYRQKNDPESAVLLGGFAAGGYSRDDIRRWMEHHAQRRDEVVWAIVRTESGDCVGHVGLYRIDHRIGSAEIGILVGDRSARGKGLGEQCTRFAVEYGFGELNLNRIQLTVLATNVRAHKLYLRLGFIEEGRMRQAQFKGGRHIDVIVMGLLRDEYGPVGEAG